MQLSTIFLKPSTPRRFNTAQADAAEAPERVPINVCWKLSVKYGVSVLRESKALASLKMIPPAGIAGDAHFVWVNRHGFDRWQLKIKLFCVRQEWQY